MYSLNDAVEIGPCILLLENAIDNSQEIIERAFDQSELNFVEIAKVYDNSGNQLENSSIRNTKTIDISPTYNKDIFWWETAQKIWRYGDEYGKKYKISFSSVESPQFLWYQKEQGFYNPHMDDSLNNPRIFSFILYLNDVEEGGETYFEHFKVSIKPKAGSLLMFPANFSYLHGAKIPQSNDKFVIVTWFNP